MLVFLFISTFLSATLVPFSSEAIVAYLFHIGENQIEILIVATLGNSLGGTTNYFIGSMGNPNWLLEVGVTEKRLNRFQEIIQKKGFWLASLSWLPFVGDPIIVALGFFKVKALPSLALMCTGKFLRYLMLLLFFI